MIENIHVKNFKSIKDLQFNCSRVNIFIGEPNTGKSNILESIGIFSLPDAKDLRNLIRIDKNFNLFRNDNTEEKIKIGLLLNDETDVCLEFGYYRGLVTAECKDLTRGKVLFRFNLTPDIQYSDNPDFIYSQYLPIRFYKFREPKEFKGFERDYLTPPFGENLPQIILQNKEMQEYVSSLFTNVGYKVEIDKHENLIKVYREGHITESIPFFLTSDTLQRMIFYNAAIESSKEAIIVFEEPESHMFPFYNEQLALLIANNSNQFFIATHNPYFLNMIINKTKTEELSVFKVYYEDYQTKTKHLDKKKLQNLVINDNDILLNIDKLGEG